MLVRFRTQIKIFYLLKCTNVLRFLHKCIRYFSDKLFYYKVKIDTTDFSLKFGSIYHKPVQIFPICAVGKVLK